MNETQHHHQKQLQEAASVLSYWMRQRITGEITFHLNGKGGLGERATVHVNAPIEGRSKSSGIEVTMNQVAKAAADREAQRATTTTTAHTPHQLGEVLSPGGNSHG